LRRLERSFHDCLFYRCFLKQERKCSDLIQKLKGEFEIS